MATLDRRLFLHGSLAGLALSSAGPALAQSETPMTDDPAAPTGRQAPSFYRFRVGDYEGTVFNDGISQMPAERLVSNQPIETVKAALAEAFLPQDQLTNTFNPLLLRSSDRTVLFDTGNGRGGDPTRGLLLTQMDAAGVDPGTVDTVVLTHFHGDHISGLQLSDGGAAFPNAQVMVPAAEWAFWTDPAQRAAAPEGQRRSFDLVERLLGGRTDLLKFEDGEEILPGVTAVASPGHTPGHTSFRVGSGADALLILGDLTNHPALFVRHPDWVIPFDMDPERAIESRRRLLDMAASERLLVTGYHYPFPALGHVAREGDGFRYVPVDWRSVLDDPA